MLLQIATGGGKTRIANDLIRQLLDEEQFEGSALWVAKDWRLLFQAASDLANRDENLGHDLFSIGGDHTLLAPMTAEGKGSVGYTTLHTLQNRFGTLHRGRGLPSLIVWDECHWAEKDARC